jgi:hypothetical protein
VSGVSRSHQSRDRRPQTAGGFGLRRGAAECPGGELSLVCYRPVDVAGWTKGSLESEAERRSTQAATATRLAQTAAERLSCNCTPFVPILEKVFSGRVLFWESLRSIRQIAENNSGFGPTLGVCFA